MRLNVYDRQLISDHRILRSIGLMLQREESVATPKPLPPIVRCAWCDREAGIKPNPDMNQSHGLCPRHHASIKANLDEMRRMAA
jgi:hypothetical protein